MGVALRGNLTDFGIAEVFQLIGQQRKTGFLDVSSGGEKMQLAFESGGVVWARPAADAEDGILGDRLVRCGLLTYERLTELHRQSETSARPIAALAIEAGYVAAADIEQIEDVITEETIFTVLRCTDGSFDFSAKAVRHDRPAEKLLAAEQILMDGLRKVDEWQTFAALVPSGETIFERTGKTEGLRQDGRRLEQVFALVDGRLAVQRIIDLSRLGLFDATRALAELHNRGMIVPVSGRRARAKGGLSDGPQRAVAERARWWLAAAFPLALLSLVVSMVVGQAPVVDGPQVFPISRDPLEQARAAFEKRRLRHALEEARLATGQWPASLSPADDPSGAVGRLASPDLDEYHYARRGNGIILLAPEQ